MRSEEGKTMRNMLRTALVMILIVVMTMTLASCKKSGGTEEPGGGTGGQSGSLMKGEYHTENAYVGGKCFVLAGMSTDEEEYDEDLLKEMFDIDDLSEYMSIYFRKDGKAYVSSLLYNDIQETDWAERDEITEMQVDEDLYEFKKDDDGMISTVRVEEDGEEFNLTFREADDAPEALKEYVE